MRTVDVHVRWLRSKIEPDPGQPDPPRHRAGRRLPPGSARSVNPRLTGRTRHVDPGPRSWDRSEKARRRVRSTPRRRQTEEFLSDVQQHQAHRRPRARRDDVRGGLRWRLRRRPRPRRAASHGRAGSQAPASMAASEAPASAGGAVSGSIIVSGSSTVEPISTGVAEAFAGDEPGLQVHGRGPRHRRRLQEVLRRRDRHLRRLAQDQGRGGQGLRRRRHRVRRAQDRLRRHVGPDLAQQHGGHLPVLRGPLRADRPRVHGLRQLERRGRHRQGARLEHRLPGRRRSSITGPGEESGTYDSFVEIALDHDRQDPRPDRRRARATPRPAPTTRASANDNAIIDGIAGSDTSLGWVGFAFAEENKDKVKEIEVAKDANGTCVAPVRRDHRRRQLPAVPLASTSTSTRPRPPRTRPSSPTSTTTWPTAPSPRSSRPSPT